uniref:RNase H type-1 domain-containing protein n=1 Tax=Arion vulgaris TaxID=1028688 RepID=A0A0B7AKT4_9EUPU
MVQTGIREITIFVLGHAGVSGNERGNRLAVIAGAAMDRNDILNALSLSRKSLREVIKKTS